MGGGSTLFKTLVSRMYFCNWTLVGIEWHSVQSELSGQYLGHQNSMLLKQDSNTKCQIFRSQVKILLGQQKILICILFLQSKQSGRAPHGGGIILFFFFKGFWCDQRPNGDYIEHALVIVSVHAVTNDTY